jgi:hypothetical protein
LLEVAPHLERFRDLNSLRRTSRFFHTFFGTLLYRRAITANDTARDGIVSWVLSKYRVASLMHLLDSGLSANHKFSDGRDLLHTLCELDDKERSRWHDCCSNEALTSKQRICFAQRYLHAAVFNGGRGIVALLLEHGADVNAVDIDGLTPLRHYTIQSIMATTTLPNC